MQRADHVGATNDAENEDGETERCQGECQHTLMMGPGLWGQVVTGIFDRHQFGHGPHQGRRDLLADGDGRRTAPLAASPESNASDTVPEFDEFNLAFVRNQIGLNLFDQHSPENFGQVR